MTVYELSYESTVLYLLIAMVCFVGSTNALVVVMLSTDLQRLFSSSRWSLSSLRPSTTPTLF